MLKRGQVLAGLWRHFSADRGRSLKELYKLKEDPRGKDLDSFKEKYQNVYNVLFDGSMTWQVSGSLLRGITRLETDFITLSPDILDILCYCELCSLTELSSRVKLNFWNEAGRLTPQEILSFESFVKLMSFAVPMIPVNIPMYIDRNSVHFANINNAHIFDRLTIFRGIFMARGLWRRTPGVLNAFCELVSQRTLLTHMRGTEDFKTLVVVLGHAFPAIGLPLKALREVYQPWLLAELLKKFKGFDLFQKAEVLGLDLFFPCYSNFLMANFYRELLLLFFDDVARCDSLDCLVQTFDVSNHNIFEKMMPHLFFALSVLDYSDRARFGRILGLLDSKNISYTVQFFFWVKFGFCFTLCSLDPLKPGPVENYASFLPQRQEGVPWEANMWSASSAVLFDLKNWSKRTMIRHTSPRKDRSEITTNLKTCRPKFTVDFLSEVYSAYYDFVSTDKVFPERIAQIVGFFLLNPFAYDLHVFEILAVFFRVSAEQQSNFAEFGQVLWEVDQFLNQPVKELQAAMSEMFDSHLFAEMLLGHIARVFFFLERSQNSDFGVTPENHTRSLCLINEGRLNRALFLLHFKRSFLFAALFRESELLKATRQLIQLSGRPFQEKHVVYPFFADFIVDCPQGKLAMLVYDETTTFLNIRAHPVPLVAQSERFFEAQGMKVVRVTHDNFGIHLLSDMISKEASGRQTN